MHLREMPVAQGLDWRATDVTTEGTSGKSSIAQMQQYFGPLRNSDIETLAADRFAHETHNLPKAYEGRNKFLMSTIDFLITKDDDWYTSRVLPWEYTEELHVQWNVWRFNKTMMDYEPHQGVPRYVSQESETHGDSMIRRGLAFIIEHGFYQTELGRQHYLMNLRQIVEAVHETAYYGVLHALLSADNHYRTWMQRHGTLNRGNYNRIMYDERHQFAIVQKDVKGLYILDAELKDRMRRQGIEPDTWVFPGKMAIYASMVPDYFTEFQRGGIQAPKSLEQGARRFDTFRGLPVYETRPFDVDFIGGEGVEPLIKNAQIGEWHCVCGQHDLEHGVELFDMNTDKFRRISIREIVKHTVLKDEMDLDDMRSLLGIKPGSRANLVKGYSTYVENWTNALIGFIEEDTGVPRPNGDGMDWPIPDGSITELIGPIVADQQGQLAEVAMAPYNQQQAGQNSVTSVKNLLRAHFNLLGALDANSDYFLRYAADMYRASGVCLYPVKHLLLRPNCTYRMGSALLLKAGSTLGHTFHGHHDFQLTDDVIHKVHIGHYTFYSKSIVRDAKQMYVAENVFCTGYVSGEDISFMKTEEDREEKSIIVVPIPYDFEVPNPLSLTGDLTSAMPTVGFDDNGHPAGWFPGAHLLARHFKFNHNSGGGDFLTDVNLSNTVCFEGCSKHYNAADRKHTDVVVNTGHWGPNVYDGCGAVRNGGYAHLKDCEYYKLK